MAVDRRWLLDGGILGFRSSGVTAGGDLRLGLSWAPMRLMPLLPHSKRLDEHHSHLALPVEGHIEHAGQGAFALFSSLRRYRCGVEQALMFWELSGTKEDIVKTDTSGVR